MEGFQVNFKNWYNYIFFNLLGIFVLIFELSFRDGDFTFRVIKRVNQVYSCTGSYQMDVKKGN